MKAQLSNKPIWITPTTEINALDNKSVCIIDERGSSQVNLRVSKADPRGPDAGKCSVATWQSIITGNPEWANTGIAPTQPTHNWRGYLNKAAIERLAESPQEESEVGQLVLDLTKSDH